MRDAPGIGLAALPCYPRQVDLNHPAHRTGSNRRRSRPRRRRPPLAARTTTGQLQPYTHRHRPLQRYVRPRQLRVTQRLRLAPQYKIEHSCFSWS